MHIPIDAMGQYTNLDELQQTLNELTDVYTDEIFRLDDKHYTQVVFPFSRVYCDVERFLDDDKEHMAKKGMGVLYTRGVNGEDFRKFDEKDKESVIALYNAHHKKVRDLIQAENSIGEKPLVVDCHSFSNKRYCKFR